MSVTRHTDVWLVRHAQTDWNRDGRYLSRADRPLTAFGRARAAALADRLRPIALHAIVSSGATYADATAATIAGRQRRPVPIVRDDRWRDADQGAWEGLTYREVSARFGAQASARFADPWSSRAHGGESSADLWTRITAAWRELLRRYDGRRVLIVTHAAPIQLLICDLLGISLARSWQIRIDLGSLSNLDLYPAGAISRVVNEIPRLREVPR